MTESLETLRQQVQALQRENLALRGENQGAHSSSGLAEQQSVAEKISASLDSWIERLVSSTTSATLEGFRDHTTAVALRDALSKLRDLTEHMSRREREVIAPLRKECSDLSSENEQLKHKIVVLQASESTRDAQNSAELEQAREVIASYKAQLAAVQKLAAESAGPINLVIAESSAAKQQVSDNCSRIAALEAEVAELKHTLAEKEAACAATVDHEKQKCAVLQEQLLDQQQHGLQMLVTLKAQGEDLQSQLLSLSSENATLRSKLEAAHAKALEDTHTVKDHRASILASVDPSSLRAQVVNFWFTGHEEIEQLKQRVMELESAEQQLPILQRDVVGMKRSRSAIVENIATISAEVERLRSEEMSAKVKCAGLEAENTLLVAQLATLLEGNLSRESIAVCGAAIRKAAADAAASTTLVLDPVAAQRARTQALELKNEVVHLCRQKEKLQRIIASREERICALNAIVATKAASGFESDTVSALVEHVLNNALAGDSDTDEQWTRRRAAMLVELESTKAELVRQQQAAALLQLQLDNVNAQVVNLTSAGEQAAVESLALHDRLRQEANTLAQINTKLSNEITRLRASHQQTCSLLQRIHEHHVSLYQFAVSQATLLSSLYEKIHSLHADLRAALARNDMSADAEDQLSEKLVGQLQQHLSSLNDAIEEDRLRRAAWESSSALQLAADVDKRDELLRKFQEAYTNGLKENSAALVTLVGEVRQAWETKLSEQRVLLEKERSLLQSRNHQEDAVLRTLTQAMLRVPPAQVLPSASTLPGVLKVETSRSPVAEFVSSTLAVHADPEKTAEASENALPTEEVPEAAEDAPQAEEPVEQE